jgi:integrase
MKRTTGRLTEKNGKWYAVINLYTTEGRRKEKWHGLDLEAKRGTKTEATHRLNEILAKYNIGEFYLEESLTHAERTKRKAAGQSVDEYLAEWLESYKCNIAVTTYNSYKIIMDSNITPFFKELQIPLKDLSGDEINDFYNKLRNKGLSGATAQRHHSLMHLAFKHAVKRRIIPSNPCDQAERPKSVQYIGTYYNAEELKALLECLEGDPMRIVVILTAYYGLRRSEVLGLKWDAIDFADKKIVIRHKIIENKLKGGTLEGLDVMKTKSSYRTLPLIGEIEKYLLDEKERQAEMQRVLRNSYNKKYLDYVCVDAVGELIRPQYATEHFKVILKRNNLKIIRFHDLRHSCASLMLANKVPMKMIQDWLGHSDMSTTANIYSHVDIASKVESALIIENVLAVAS